MISVRLLEHSTGTKKCRTRRVGTDIIKKQLWLTMIESDGWKCLGNVKAVLNSANITSSVYNKEHYLKQWS